MKNFVWISFLIVMLSACGRQPSKINDPVISAEAQDPELEKAKKDALSNLDHFMRSFHAHSNDSIFDYSLKIDFIEAEEHEHMWVTLLKIDSGQFIGSLGNDPQNIKNIKYGDTVKLTKDQIEDWMIYDNRTDTWQGGYSTKVLMSRQ